MMNPIRWIQRLENYQKANQRLQQACQQDSYTELERAGLIQTFEFTYELSWKTLKEYAPLLNAIYTRLKEKSCEIK